ncbi:hypothetical protein [Methanohalophilus sp.]|uniref:prenylated flavin chaperone LpdD n=1 Tax=Methanohalophilus sp. TaxID=1966352 RepID=UPI00260AD70D|nr:hypothetical protein [Methanohalophilus sp.]MDK2891782.1 hypothetical protein [Methanohalophilus sp.]
MQTIEHLTSRGKLSLSYTQLGNDLIAILSGGDQHMGAVAVSTYDNHKGFTSSSVITIPGHLDDLISYPLSRLISEAISKNVVFITGIHFDNITKDEIEEITAVSYEMADELINIIEGD